MAELSRIVGFLDKELQAKRFNRLDYCINGLQFKGSKEVRKLGFAVDPSLVALELAKKNGCDMLITHHALFGKKIKYPEMHRLKKRWLRKNRLSVYCSHSPLDANNRYGNNGEMMRMLGIRKFKDFGLIEKIVWGKAGKLGKPMSAEQVTAILSKKIGTKFTRFLYGKKMISTIAVVSGSGSDCYAEAIKKKIDMLVVGEVRYSHSVNVKDLRLNMISGGHYMTETLGVKALMPALKRKFNVDTIFLYSNTGI